MSQASQAAAAPATAQAAAPSADATASTAAPATPAVAVVATPAEATAPAAAAPAKTEAVVDQPKSEPAAPAEPAKPAAPEKYDLKLPENSLLDATHVGKIAALAKANGLTNEQAQGYLEAESEAVATYVEQRKEAWKSEAIADPEIGGDAAKQNVELAHRVLERYATPKLKEELNKTGYGNHPELVRMLVRLGKEMAPDSLVIPGTQSGGKKSMEDVFYGETKTKQE